MSHHAFFEVSIPTLPTCTQLILEMTSEAPATIVIDSVDALGNSSQDLLDALQYLVEDSSSVLKVVVSSREDAVIAKSSSYQVYPRNIGRQFEGRRGIHEPSCLETC